MTHIHPDKHICVKTFVEFSGQFLHPSIEQNSTTRLFQRINMNYKAAMNLALLILSSKCIVHMTSAFVDSRYDNRVSKEARRLDKNEKLWRYVLRSFLSFLLDGLRSDHLVMERAQDIDDRLVKQIMDVQQTKINAAENLIATFINTQAYRPEFGSPSPNPHFGSRMFSNTRDSTISRNNINNVAGNLNFYSNSWQYHLWPVLALLTLILLLVILYHALRLSGRPSVV
ncbi:hypothetical protein F5887DRAFT_922823 [Amanita rubescens]|nr:hypothetical protein F5887DRAFT_922823 [Amanita rubescens]